MAGFLEVRSNVIYFIVVFIFAGAASGIMICCQFIAILINVIFVVIDSSAF